MECDEIMGKKSKENLVQKLTQYININGYPKSKCNDFKPKNNLSGAKRTNKTT